MGATLSHNPGPLTPTKTKIYIIAALILTWWFAHFLPRYEPAIKSAVRSRLEEARKKMPSIQVDWHREEDPRSNYNHSKVALLVEQRYIPHLVPLMLHMITVVPPDWRFVFIGSEKSTKAVGRSLAIQHQQVIGKLDLMVLPEPWDIGSKEMVYRVMTDMRFYDEFLPGVEWILKYESDSILCANAETSLNDWLDWSWAGAPRAPDDRFAGNGGLSLRRVSVIRKILSFQTRFNDSEPEDEWFGTRLWVLPDEKVPYGTYGALAVEEVYVEKPMGFHVRDGGAILHESVWKNRAQRQAIFDYCPELSMIMDMKLEKERCGGDTGEGVIDEEEAARLREEARQKEVEEARKQHEEEDRKKQEAEDKKKQEHDQEQQQTEHNQHQATGGTTETAGESQVDPKPETEPETKSEINQETNQETKPETKPETNQETKPETELETKPETQTGEPEGKASTEAGAASSSETVVPSAEQTKPETQTGELEGKASTEAGAAASSETVVPSAEQTGPADS